MDLENSHTMSSPSRISIRAIGRLVPVLAGLAALPLAAAAQSPAETGVWLDDTGSGAIEIYVCADRNDRLCGRIIWLKEPLNAQGVPKRDKYNPTASMQTRPICGLPMLGNLQKSTEGGYDDGWIYDPKVGKSYSAAIQLASSGRLTVTGYVGVKFLGKSFTWTRAPSDLVRCNSTASANQIKAARAAQAAQTETKPKGADAQPTAKAATKQAVVPDAPASKPAPVAAPAAPSTQEANAEPASVPSSVQAPTPSSPAPVAAEQAPQPAPSMPAAEATPPQKAEAKTAPAQKVPAPKKQAAAKPAPAKTAAAQAPPSGQPLPGGAQRAGVGGPRPGLMPWELYGIGDDKDVTR
jgi:uncharacterized protein (DUF2147 family)